MRLELSENDANYVPMTDEVFVRAFNQYHTLGTDLVTLFSLIATEHGLEDKGRQVVRVLPHAPDVAPPSDETDSQHPQEQFDIDGHNASLARLLGPSPNDC
jgi:hypothetical protein